MSNRSREIRAFIRACQEVPALFHRALPGLSLCLAACQPSAADDYLARGDTSPAARVASDPLPSPDTQGAIWAAIEGQNRIVYGKPDEAPLFGLACIGKGAASTLRFTRYSPADEGAKAFMAVIGNGHVARLKVDATRAGKGWLWQGETPIENDRLEAFTGSRGVEATVPGAGTLKLNGSHLPGQLIDYCRAQARSDVSGQQAAPAGPA